MSHITKTAAALALFAPLATVFAATEPAPSGAPPGWYPDPSGAPGRQRYFDGQQWTERYTPPAGPVQAAPGGTSRIGQVMHKVLSRNIYLVKHVGKPKLSNDFDIYDPNSSSVIMECRADTGRDFKVTTPDGQPIVRVKRGASLTFSKTIVLDENEQQIGSFKQGFNWVGDFQILDAEGNLVCRVHPNMSGKDFRFVADKIELAHITCKSSGIVKNLFRHPDNYVLSISESVPSASMFRPLSLATVLLIEFAWRAAASKAEAAGASTAMLG